MRPFIRVFPFLISIALAHGCFKETSSSDEEGGCQEGTAGCDCYGNGTCDGGLECVEGKCYEPGCTPGTELCRCVDGLCLGGLVCEENVCRPPPEDGTGGDGDGSGGDGSGGDGSGDDGGTATGGPPPICEPKPGDGPCISCAKGNCCDLLQPCMEEPECACFLECLDTGDPDPQGCAQQCGPSGVLPQVNACFNEFCAEACPMDGPCQVPPNAPQCMLCAAEMCCPLLEACLAIDQCACMEHCMATGGAFDDCAADCDYQPDAGPELGELQMCAEANDCIDPDGQTCYGS